MPQTITIRDQFFYLASVHDGDVKYHRETAEVFEHDPEYDEPLTEWAAEILARKGLTFDYGEARAYDPDGSHTVDYGAGEECERAGFFDGFSDAQLEELRGELAKRDVRAQLANYTPISLEEAQRRGLASHCVFMLKDPDRYDRHWCLHERAMVRWPIES